MVQARSGIPSVKYRGDDALNQGRLRVALFEAWDGKCAWCGTQIPDSSYVQIDHVLPQSKFAEGKVRFDLPADVELHDVENLAPLCAAGRSCNRVKSNNLFTGATADVLRSASIKAERVRRHVQRMREATGLDADMQRLLSAPLNDSNRRVFEHSGRLLAQRLDAVLPELIDGRIRVRRIQLDDVEPSPVGSGCFGADDDHLDATVALTEAGREAYAVARLACQIELDEVIAAALTALIEQLDQRVRDAGLQGDVTDGGFVLTSQRELSVHTMSVELQSGGGLTFSGQGHVWSLHSASIAWVGDDGKTLDGQSDVVVDGTFEFLVRTSVPDADVPTQFDDIEVDHSGVEVNRV